MVAESRITQQEVGTILAGREGSFSKPTDDDLRPVYDYLAATFVANRNEGPSHDAGQSPHWFCTRKLSALHQEAATFLIFLFAYNRVERAQLWMKELEGVVRGCEKCARGFGAARRSFETKYLSKFPAQVRANFAGEVDKRQAEFIKAEYVRVCDRSADGKEAGFQALPTSIVQLALSQPSITGNPAIQAILNDTAQSSSTLAVPSIISGGLSAGLVRILASEDSAKRKWAMAQLKDGSRHPIGLQEWRVSAVGEEFWRLVIAEKGGEEGKADDSVAGLRVILEGGWLSEEVIQDELLGGSAAGSSARRDGSVMAELCPLLGSDTPNVLFAFTALLRASPTHHIWSFDRSPELPHTLFSDIKSNPAYQRLLETAASEPPELPSTGNHSLEDLLSWIGPYLLSVASCPDASSVGGQSGFGETLAKACSFCFSEMQHSRNSSELRAGVGQAGFQALLLLQSRIDTNQNSLVSRLSSPIDIHAAFITSVAFRPKDYPNPAWTESRSSALCLLSAFFHADGRDLVECTLGLALVAQEERTRLRKVRLKRPAGPAVRVETLRKASVCKELWNMAYNALLPTDTAGMAVLMKAIAPSSHLDLLDRGHPWRGDDLAEAITKEQWVDGIRSINAGIQAVRSNFDHALEAFSMQPDPAIVHGVWQILDLPRSAIVLLLSPVDRIHEPTIDLLSRAFDCDERIDCFRALLTKFPGQAVDGLCEFLDRFVLIAQSSPESCSLAKWLVRCFTDVLEVLCSASAGEAPLLQSSEFLEDHTGNRSMATRLRNLWHSMTTALAVIFKRTQAWAPLFDNDVMVDWMRDALIFGRQIADNVKTFEAAVLGQPGLARTDSMGESPIRMTQSGRALVAQLHVVLVDLVSWLRLTDVETLHQTFQLIREILTQISKKKPDLEKEVKLATALGELDKFCRKATKSYISRLSDDTISELSELLRPFELGLGDDDIQFIKSIEGGMPSGTSSPVPDDIAAREPSRSTVKGKNAFEEMMRTAKGGSSGRDAPASSRTTNTAVTASTKPGAASKPIDVDDFEDDFLDNLSTGDLDLIENRAKTAYTTGKPIAGNNATRKSVLPRVTVPTQSRPPSKLHINVTPKTAHTAKPAAKSGFSTSLMKDLRREHQAVIAQRNKVPTGGISHRLPAASSAGTGLGAYQPPKKLQPVAASDSSSEESSDDDDDGGGLTQLIKKQKSPLKPARTVHAPRQIQVLGAPLADMMQKREEERQRQYRIKQRLRPDVSQLYRYVLSWDPGHTGTHPPYMEHIQKQLSTPSMIPVNFPSAAWYEQVMLPLFLQELWAQCQKEEPGRIPIAIEVTSRSYEDDFVDLEITNQGAIPERFYLNESEVVILQQPGNPKQLFARVQNVRRRMNDMLIKLRIVKEADQHSLGAKVRWLLYKHMSLSTALREYGALQGLPYYEKELLMDILAGRSARMPRLDQYSVDGAMRSYQVNEPQARAILGALNTNGFALIQGPPGTGKTKTISGLVGKWISDRPNKIAVAGAEKPKKIKLLVCAPSNAAIDEVCKRLMNGVPSSSGGQYQPIIVRIGIDASVNDAVKDRSIDNLVEARINSDLAAKGSGGGDYARLQAELEEVKQSIRTKQSSLQNLSHNDEGRRAIETELHALMTRRTHIGQQASKAKDAARDASRHLDGARRNAREAILDEADIVCATLSGAGQNDLTKHEFETVIIDEAAQAIELSCLIPLKYGCKRCIMVGDPNQLPPTTFSVEAEKFHYNQSLFVRMAKANPANLHLLSIQYRMHPYISELPSKVFYNAQLKNGPDMAAKTAAIWHARHAFGPYRFFNVAGHETRAGTSTKNADEALVAVELYRRLEADFGEKVNLAFRIGVITMYKEQLYELKRAFNNAFGAAILNTIEFNTVDGFQGQEKDIIILSCVRSGPNLNTIGFLRDARRMNVALTRAKSSLFVIGNASTLERGDERWKTIVGDARERGFLIDYQASTFAAAPLVPPSVTPAAKKKVRKEKVDPPDTKPQLSSPSASLGTSPLKRKAAEAAEDSMKRNKVEAKPSPAKAASTLSSSNPTPHIPPSVSGTSAEAREMKPEKSQPVQHGDRKPPPNGTTSLPRPPMKGQLKDPNAGGDVWPPLPPKSAPKPAPPPVNPASVAFIKKKKKPIAAPGGGSAGIPNVRQTLNEQYLPKRP